MKMYKLSETGHGVIDIPNTYESIKNELSWNDAWNTPTMLIRGKPFIIICSDLGKMKHMKVSCLSYPNLIVPRNALKEPFVVGEVIVTKFDGVDDFESLTKEDIELIESRLIETPNLSRTTFFDTILVID